MALLSAHATEIAIPVCIIIGIAFSLWLWLFGWRNINNQQRLNPDREVAEARRDRIRNDVSKGVNAFLFMEYRYVGVFMVSFAILIFLFLGPVASFSTQSRPCTFDPSNMCKPALATAVSFLLGAFASVLSGLLGMKIAIYANARTALEEGNGFFNAAFRSGAVMGFLLSAISLLMLYIIIIPVEWYYGTEWEGLFEAITGYGLGGSSMALLGRAGGGIYAIAADVCVHLVTQIRPEFPQDCRNPAVIPNYVGDIVGDIAGIWTDLFGSYATCAALVVASISSFGIDRDFTTICYPLLISSMGVLVCLITTLVATNFSEDIWRALKKQLFISTTLMTIGIAIVSWIALPSSFTIYHFGSQKVVKDWQLSLCVGVGLWAALIIGLVTRYHNNDDFRRIQNFVARMVDVGLSSDSIPIFAAISILVSSRFAVTYGITVAALGMLSTIATRLAIDAYGPISDNAKRIANMACGKAPDSAVNTTAAIGKGFAIESAALVSIALICAFASRASISRVDVQTLTVIVGWIVGTKLPNHFSVMTMKSVGRAGLKMAQEVCRQLQELPLIQGDPEPDYATCIRISTKASFWGMILPGALVIFTPLIVGTVFGVEMLSGVLAGSLSSVVKIACSASSGDGAWNKAKENIWEGALENATDEWIDHLNDCQRADIIGDKRRDTIGPFLLLIQLMAVESLVFARFFATHGGLLFKIF